MEFLTGAACRGHTALLTMECPVAQCAANILVRSPRIMEGRGFKSHLELRFFSFEFSVESISKINNKIRYEKCRFSSTLEFCPSFIRICTLRVLESLLTF